MARRTKKILVYSSIAAILAVTFFFLYSHYKNKLIRDTVNEKVNLQNDGLYRITYDSLYLDEVNGELFVTKLKVIPDTARFRGRDMTSEDPLSLVAISAEKLHITGVKTPQALLNKEVAGGRIFISDVNVTLFKLRSDTGKGQKESLESIMYNDVLSRLKLIKVDTISVEHVNFRMENFRKHKEIFSATNTSVTLYDAQIDSATVFDSSRILFSKNVTAQVEEAVVKSKDGKYKYRFHNIELSSFSRSLHLNEVNLTPSLSETAFMQQLKTQNDRFDFNLKDISIKGIDFSKISVPELMADSLLVGQSSFKIYRDLNVGRDSVSRLEQYPHQAIMKLPFDLTIKKAVLSNSFIEYKERNNKSKNSGKVQFYKVTAYIDNITNAKESLAKNNICTLDFNSSFLNRAPLKARLVMRLGDKQGKFTIKGSLGKIAVNDLNPLTEPMGLAKMETGTIQKMEFDITATKYHATGTVLLIYDDLKVSLLKKDDDEYKKKGLASFAANIIVVNANPKKDKTRIAKIDYDRNVNRSFFNMIWKSIFTGIKESVGMK